MEQAEPAAEEKEKEEPSSGKGKGGKKGGKGKGGKGKGKDKEEKEEKEDEGEGAGGESVIDEIWPKKEALGLTKWLVVTKHAAFKPKNADTYAQVMIGYQFSPFIQYPFSSSTSTVPSSRL